MRKKTVNNYRTTWTGVVDCVLFPLVIIMLTYSPFHKHGFLLAWDEGYPLSWANAVMLGQVPFRDFYVNFGPGFVYLLVFFMKCFGLSLAALREFMYLGNALSLIAVFFCIRKLVRSRLVLLAGCWMICASVVMPFWISRWGGIRNGVVFVPMLLLIYYQWNRKKAFLAMAGVTAALSFYVSQEMGVLAVLLFIVSAAYRLLYDPLSRRDVTACMKEAAIFIGSFGGSLLGLYGYLMMNGARLENIGISLFSMPREFLRYYKNPPRFAFPGAEASLLDIVNFIKAPTFDFFFTPVIYALGSLYLFRKRKAFDRSDFTLMLFTVYGWCMFIIGIRGFSGPQITGPQFNFALVTVIVMELFLIQKLIDRARAVSVIPAKKNDASSRISRTRALALAVLVALFAVYTRTPSAYSGYLTKNLTFPGVEARVSSLPGLGGAIVPPAQESTMSRVCDFIMKHTGPDDYIYAFPHEPQYYFFSRRRCPTLFTNALDAGIDPRYERAAIADIERKNVTYAIFVSDSYSVMDNAMIPNEKRIPLIYAFFQERYAPVNVIDGTVIMKKREVRR